MNEQINGMKGALISDNFKIESEDTLRSCLGGYIKLKQKLMRKREKNMENTWFLSKEK